MVQWVESYLQGAGRKRHRIIPKKAKKNKNNNKNKKIFVCKKKITLLRELNFQNA
jgi:hypothetical protein